MIKKEVSMRRIDNFIKIWGAYLIFKGFTNPDRKYSIKQKRGQ